MTTMEPLPSPLEIIQQYPLPIEEKVFIDHSRETIRNILDGTDQRLLFVVGPCSIHDLAAAKEYASRLSKLNELYSETYYFIMRVYFEKPRTALGWKGLLYDPHLNGSNDIATGISWTRELLLELAAMKVPVASEFLDPISPHYFGDLISWACIGARTSSSQIHRQMASGLPMPVAFKNNTDGNIHIAIDGILTAHVKHSFMNMNEQGKISQVNTQGNPYGHLVLRGGKDHTNYDPESINRALVLLKEASLPELVIIDCAHGNSNRNHAHQAQVFKSVLQQKLQGNSAIRGVIVESHLNAGNQSLTSNLHELKYAVSLTDPCLDWESTHDMIHWGHFACKQVIQGLEAVLV